MEDVFMIDSSSSGAMNTMVGRCPNCGTCTHPLMVDHGHIPSFKRFLDDVNDGVRRSIEGKADYKAVRVLLIRWEIDSFILEGRDNGVQGEIDSLKKIFGQDYNFQTETWLIPHEEAERALRRKIFFFEDENSDPSTLLLVYYGGHGVLDERNQSIWAEGRSRDSPKVEWFSIQPQLEKSRSNVVLILDCCYAGSANASSPNGSIQVLAACGRENTTIAPGDWSFTSRLAETLKAWSSKSFTITQLHAELVNLRALSGHKKLYNTPSHYIQHKTKCSVRIARLTRLAPLWTPPLVSDESSSEESLPAQVSFLDEPRVLISVFVDSSAREDPQAWLDWLRTHMPSYITGVRLEGLFGSHSTLGLFSLPVRVWDCIPDNAAYTFVSFTTTTNIFIEHLGLNYNDSANPDSAFGIDNSSLYPLLYSRFNSEKDRFYSKNVFNGKLIIPLRYVEANEPPPNLYSLRVSQQEKVANTGVDAGRPEGYEMDAAELDEPELSQMVYAPPLDARRTARLKRIEARDKIKGTGSGSGKSVGKSI